MACEMCFGADPCKCTDVKLINQTQDMPYSDGSRSPHTETLPLCWECRVLFVAWGDIIRAA